jgi:hypothetical protein
MTRKGTGNPIGKADLVDSRAEHESAQDEPEGGGSKAGENDIDRRNAQYCRRREE